MTTRYSITLAILSAFLLTSVAQAAESVSVLLQKAIYAEETEGDLEAAIKIYEGITRESDANRSLVAQAQYRLGVCELKRGKKDEAEASFRKILSQFGDQKELSAKARERLGEMGKDLASVVVRQVWSGTEATRGRISSDGRFLAFSEVGTGNLAIRELANGRNRRLTDKARFERGHVQFADSWVFSKDGQRIAHGWYGATNKVTSSGLYIVSMENGEARCLAAQATNHWFTVEDWSANGESLAVYYSKESEPKWSGIALVSTIDGSMRKIAEVGPSDNLHALFLFNPSSDSSIALSVAESNTITMLWGMHFTRDILRYFLSVGMKDAKTGRWDGRHKLLSVWHDVATGTKREEEILHLADSGWPYGFVLSSDEKRLFFVRNLGEPSTNAVVIARDFTTGSEMEILYSTNRVEILGRPASEDTVIVAALTGSGRGGLGDFIKGIEVTKTSAKERFSVQPPEGAALVVPEGSHSKTHVLLSRNVRGPSPGTELWTISRKTGAIRKTDLLMQAKAHVIGCDADGRQVFFQAVGSAQMITEVWLMENFLPPVTVMK